MNGPRLGFGSDPILVFVEVVATDGAITERRRDAVFELTDAAGFDRSHIAFLTAYQDRNTSGFKKTVAELAWGSVVWFVSEPDHLVILHRGEKATTLAELLRVGSTKPTL